MILAELPPRLGGDPRDSAEYSALRDELLKLNHPARPDVDWQRVEHLCLALQQQNGIELQTLAALTVARTHQFGLAGMLAGVGELTHLAMEHWAELWPQADAARMEILAWLFAQLQPLLRGFALEDKDLLLARQLQADLSSLDEFLTRHVQVPLIALQSLRQMLCNVIRRLEREATPDPMSAPGNIEVRVQATGVTASTPHKVTTISSGANPTVVVVKLEEVQPPVLPEKKKTSRSLMWLLGFALILAMLWLLWRAFPPSIATIDEQPSSSSSTEPVRVDSLLLFPAGSAELKPESTKLLIASLINIKAQPGWMIVITGHSDSTGDPQKNLELSRARAAAVRDWMQRMGDIPGSCFVVRGAGAGEPIASDGTEEGRNANRRVDISLMPVMGACKKG